MLNASSITRVLNSLDLSQSRQRRARYNRLYHEALIIQEVGKGISFNNMLLLLVRHTVIDAHKMLTSVNSTVLRVTLSDHSTFFFRPDELQQRESMDAYIADIVNLDRVRSMLRGMYHRRKYLAWKEQQRAEAANSAYIHISTFK